ncbi:hypothetical protein GCK72_010385 [Caenorhabditis remanei]|uniref:C2 domain-containing protein n=1 Tax=Caenorhabditis remanei TaxID=31234 RepID=A0A6A5H6G9_CAERE|nr:hypothetical protein GCK72_010385 [Caenorhabditis remanei]KAF1762123.1 hypothetical protein GCK72_010385 [Caenorhabditis remanei]
MWIHVNVVSIERKACPIDETSWGTETSGCASMSYMTLDERILPHHERRSSSFEYVNGIARPTVTHWPKGRLADWMVSIQFISVDPVYGLARTCDRSGYVRVFQNETLNWEREFSEKTLEIQGQCFIASVKVQASNEVCPWCVDDSKTTTKTTTTEIPSTDSPAAFLSFDSSNTSVLIVMSILASFSFLALTATTILLIVYIMDRKKPEYFDMPPPQANSTVLARNDQIGLFTTKSSERWTEYGSEAWASFQPLNVEAAFISPRDTCVYRVTQEEDDSSDSGNASL